MFQHEEKTRPRLRTLSLQTVSSESSAASCFQLNRPIQRDGSVVTERAQQRAAPRTDGGIIVALRRDGNVGSQSAAELVGI